MDRCIICSEISYNNIFNKGGYDLTQCNRCGMIKVEPLPTEHEIKQLYQEYGSAQYTEEYIYGQMNKEKYEGRFLFYKDILKKYYNSNDKILDIGAHCGEFLKLLKESGFDTYGVEINKTMAYEVKNKYKIPVVSKDLLEIKDDNKYDFISALSVIEHTINPHKQLEKVHDMLEDDGYLLLEVPNVNSIESKSNYHFFADTLGYWFEPTPPIHLWEFDKNTIVKILNKNKFEVVESGTFNPFEFDNDNRFPEGYYIHREGLTQKELDFEEEVLFKKLSTIDNTNENVNEVLVHIGKKLIKKALEESAKFSQVMDNKSVIWVLAKKRKEDNLKVILEEANNYIIENLKKKNFRDSISVLDELILIIYKILLNDKYKNINSNIKKSIKLSINKIVQVVNDEKYDEYYNLYIEEFNVILLNLLKEIN